MSGWVWSPSPVQLNAELSGQAYTPDLSTNPLPWGGGTNIYCRGWTVVPSGGISFETGVSAPAEGFSFINKYFYVGSGGPVFGGEAKLPTKWESVPLPQASGWVDDPGFGRGF